MTDVMLYPLVEDRWEPDDIELFLFSAALWLPHRIHYDREFARSDGHRGLVVHGPLQIARLLEAADAWTRPTAGRITAAEFRHVAPAVVGDAIQLSLGLSGDPPGSPESVVQIGARAAVLDSAGGLTPTTTGTITIMREV
jgi:acyl dehydratase